MIEEILTGISYEWVAGAGAGVLCKRHAMAVLRFCWGQRTNPYAWMTVLILMSMLPAFVPVWGFWPVTAVEVALGALVVLGMVRGWTNEAIHRALANTHGGLYGRTFGKTRAYRRLDAMSRAALSGLLIRG